MRPSVLISVMALGVSATALTGTASAQSPSVGSETRGYIVVVKDSAAPRQVADEHSRRYDAQIGHIYRHALRGYSARMSDTAAARLADDSRVLFVQLDGVVHATKPGEHGKPTKPGDGGEDPAAPLQSLPSGINRSNADASPTAAIDRSDGRVGVHVAVIDTGVDLDHPDLNVYRAGAKNCSTGRSADDGNGHGTHVAGTIGAIDDAAGVVGMAPGATLWPIRVLNNAGSGTFSDIVCGIDYVTAHADQIDVANMSLGGSGIDDGNCGRTNGDAMHTAICSSVAAGITYVVAAGNSGEDSAAHVPAAYDEVITVSALADFNGVAGGGAVATCRPEVDDTFAVFSNYGADVDLIAPGVCITSTWKGGGYDTISGTSMASPHVAGAAALYAATHPVASPAEVKSALQSAGSTDWNANDDGDSTKERLLDVTGF